MAFSEDLQDNTQTVTHRFVHIEVVLDSGSCRPEPEHSLLSIIYNVQHHFTRRETEAQFTARSMQPVVPLMGPRNGGVKVETAEEVATASNQHLYKRVIVQTGL